MRVRILLSFFMLFAATFALKAEAQAINWNGGVTYTYDGSGNVRRMGNDFHVYDSAGRLVQSDTNTVRRNYQYDAFGNRQACSQPGTDCQYGYAIGSSNNHIAAAGHDASGNVESFETHFYTHDALNMPTRDQQFLNAREYIYTADDERIAVYSVGSTWRWTVRDTNGKVLRELTSQNGATLGTASWNWVKDYVWRAESLLATRQAESSGTSTYHYHIDHLGTPRRITDDTDRLVGAHDYHAFGPEASGGTHEPSRTAIKFTGHERDVVGFEGPDTFDYMHARYYSPMMGRFMSVDPGKDWDPSRPQTWNMYAYARNSPILRVDPNGRSSLVFNRHAGYVALYSGEGVLIGAWPAANNADSKSRGSKIWPAGQYAMEDQTAPRTHATGDTVDGEYGSVGIFRAQSFSDNGVIRSGMGVHAGRENDADGAGRSGVEHATMGCIRTTEEGMEIIAETAPVDPVESIRVEDDPNEPRTDLGEFGEFLLPVEDELYPEP